MIKFRDDVDLIQFLRAVELCDGKVEFYSGQGDILNLKSVLSRYLFAAMTGKKNLLSCGWIRCEKTQDRKLLDQFIKEEKEDE